MRTIYSLAAIAAVGLTSPTLAQEIEADHRGIVIGDRDTKLIVGGRVHFDLATIDEDASTTFKDDAGWMQRSPSMTIGV